MTRRPPRPTLFPYTTLFRSAATSMPPVTWVEPLCDDALAIVVVPPLTSSVPAPDTLEPALRLWVPESSSVAPVARSEEHTSELQSHSDLVCRLLLEKKKTVI